MSGTKIAMPPPNSFQSGALSFISCTSGKESSPLDENDSHQTAEFKTETKKKRFHPLRNLRRMFRRKTRRSSISAESYQIASVDSPEITPSNLEQRSCSTSRLQEETLTQNLFRNSRLNPGLSLSHDSIFTPDRADSGLSSSDLENSSLSITVLTPPFKECPIKSQSSCSETSLLSIGSSEVELSPIRTGKISDLDVDVIAYTLSHSAAKHKMAVKPRRNHGAPKSRRRALTPKSPLPITFEVSEEGAPGKSFPPLSSPAVDRDELHPKCDKRAQDTKISWSDIAADSSAKELEEKKSVKLDDELDAKEEEVTTQRSESFFGRFLSRRSDKKKKLLQEANLEDSNEEKANFVKKLTKSMEGKGLTRKAPNRRQRVESIEIPPTSCLNKSEMGKDKEEFLGRNIPGSVSPPKSYWSNQVTSHSMSPPKVVWPESATSNVKTEDTVPTLSDRAKENVLPTNQSTDNILKDWKNLSFVKELTDSINSFAREKSGKREKDEEEDGSALKVRRQHSVNATPHKSSQFLESILDFRDKSCSLESVESGKSCGGEAGFLDMAPKETGLDPSPFSVQTPSSPFPISFETIHDGYENIQIIEQVKQEVRNSLEAQSVVTETKTETVPELEALIRPEISFVKADREKQNLEREAEVLKKIKPSVSEKPKDLKRSRLPELSETRLNAEPKTLEEGNQNNETLLSKTKITLVERRKSELMLLTEAEEKELKSRIKPLKKQASFSESSTEKDVAEHTERISFLKDKESSAEKNESAPDIHDIVVLRKKSVANTSDEQPELMKVFARRSLKVREGEKLAEEMQKSRDSDKENEVVESSKEDRKKCTPFERDEKKESEKMISKEGARLLTKEKSDEVKVMSVSSLKPEIASRKTVPQRYGRSLSENNGKAKEQTEPRRESIFLEENKLNKIRTMTEETLSLKLAKDEKEQTGVEEGAEAGFKRIQQRKAEWERRAQQGAK